MNRTTLLNAYRRAYKQWVRTGLLEEEEEDNAKRKKKYQRVPSAKPSGSK